MSYRNKNKNYFTVPINCVTLYVIGCCDTLSSVKLHLIGCLQGAEVSGVTGEAGADVMCHVAEGCRQEIERALERVALSAMVELRLNEDVIWSAAQVPPYLINRI